LFYDSGAFGEHVSRLDSLLVFKGRRPNQIPRHDKIFHESKLLNAFAEVLPLKVSSRNQIAGL
jgi:hypothetical protein